MDKNEVLKDISLTVHKGEVISIIGSSGSGNQPSYAPLTYLKHQLMVKSFIMDKNVLEKGYDLTQYREKLGMERRKVDFPLPELPMIEITSPLWTVSECLLALRFGHRIFEVFNFKD